MRLWLQAPPAAGHRRLSAAQAQGCQHARPRRATLVQAQRSWQPFEDDDEDGGEVEEQEQDDLLKPGGNNIRRLALEVAKEGYDLDTEWDSLRGSIISTTTGAAKVFSPTVGSGERPVPLLKPPTNPQVERLRREDYEPKQRRRLFAREEEDYEGDYLGTSSFASSSSDEESMPLWPPGGAAAPSGVGPSQRPAWGPAAAPQRQDRLKGSSGAPPVSETEREVNRIEAALREAWRQSQAAPGTATPPALRRPGSAAAESPPTTSPGSRSSRSSGASNVRSSDLGLPVLGVPSSTPAKLPRVPPPTASASGVLLTVAAGLAANKQLESEHAAFEAQMASLMQKRSGAGASPSGQQLARPSSSPAPTPAASQQAPARAGATGPSTQRAAMSPPAASPLVLGDEPLQFPKELKTALRSGKGAGAAQRPATRAGSGGDGQAQARQQQTHGAGAEQQGRSQALPTGAQSGSGASDELQVLRKAAQAATAKRRVHRPPKPANGAAPASTDGQGTAPAPLPGSSRQEAAEGRPLFPAGVQLALQGKTQGQQRPIRPDGSAHVAKQAPSLQRPGSAAPGAAPVVPPPPGKQQQQPPLQRPRPRRP